MTDTEAAVPASQPPAAEVKPVDLSFDTSAPAPDSDSMAQPSSLSNPNQQDAKTGLSAVYKRVKDNANVMLETRKPISEFLDYTGMSKPASISEVTGRLQKNLSYYRTNYFILFLGTMALTFLLHPFSIIWLTLVVLMWVYLFLVHSGPLTIGGREFSDKEKVIWVSLASFIIIFFLTNVATMALYGLSITMGVVALHGAFREPDDLFLDDAGGNNQLFSNNMFQLIPTLQSAPAGANMV
jgi:PRA1 family protein 1